MNVTRRPDGAPGLGLGWTRVAAQLAQMVPREEIERIWLFPPVRREDREWGTAVVARSMEGGRLRVYTAQYLLVVRGRERGQGKVTVSEVGETSEEVLAEVISGVQERTGEAVPPVEIASELWFQEDDESSASG